MVRIGNDKNTAISLRANTPCIQEFLFIAQENKTHLAFLPMGETLIMPLLNSTKVPLMTGISSSEIYRRQNFARAWYFSSPNHPMKLCDAKGRPSLYAVSPFSAKP